MLLKPFEIGYAKLYFDEALDMSINPEEETNTIHNGIMSLELLDTSDDVTFEQTIIKE